MELDDTDRAILELLLEDARRPYSELADAVGVSAPTVSDRISRLEELGVINGFTVDVDRSLLTDGLEVLIDVTLEPDADRAVSTGVGELEAVEHVFETADRRLLLVATTSQRAISSLLADALDLAFVDSYRVHVLETRQWSPAVATADLALTCAECTNSVESGGVSSRLDGTLYHFCCPTCQSAFEERYETFRESA